MITEVKEENNTRNRDAILDLCIYIGSAISDAWTDLAGGCLPWPILTGYSLQSTWTYVGPYTWLFSAPGRTTRAYGKHGIRGARFSLDSYDKVGISRTEPKIVRVCYL